MGEPNPHLQSDALAPRDIDQLLLAGISSQEHLGRNAASSKRMLDAVLALSFLIILLPLFLLIAGTILLVEGRPILFRHKRVGRMGEAFHCLKFRTMKRDGDAILSGHLRENLHAKLEWDMSRKLKKDPRITFLGRLLRRSSMDELPQLINILRGDMSFVGPRPIVRDEIPFYGHRISAYTQTRPGLTGLWQISGRSDASYETRVRLDCEYVQNPSFSRDLLIIVKTIPAIFFARGSY